MAWDEHLGWAEGIRQATPWLQAALISPLQEREERRRLLRDYLMRQAEAGRIERLVFGEEPPRALDLWDRPELQPPDRLPTLAADPLALPDFLRPERPRLAPRIQRPLEGTEPFDVFRAIVDRGELPEDFVVRPGAAERPLTEWQRQQLGLGRERLDLAGQREARLLAQMEQSRINQENAEAHRAWQRGRATTPADRVLNQTMATARLHLSMAKFYEERGLMEEAKNSRLEAERLRQEIITHAEKTGAIPNQYFIDTIDEIQPGWLGIFPGRQVERRVVVPRPAADTPRPTPAPAGRIRVRLKATGQTGTIPAGEFNPELHERIP